MPVGNNEQNNAIMSEQGPVLVLAGPGSGKTFTIIQRIKYLIQNCNTDPSTILVITFSKSAAVELKTRFDNSVDNEFYPVNFGTFHSVFYHIIKDTNHFSNLNVITTPQKRKFIKSIIKNHSIFDIYEQDLLDAIITNIASFKNNGGLNWNEDNLMTEEQFMLIYEEYQQILYSQRMIDFEDMMIRCHELLRNNQKILSYYREKFKSVLIDEYQDINTIQYEIIKLLAYPNNNIFAVGDDDQAIYGFRGSKPEIMQLFQNDFTNAKIMKLITNYRSSRNIIDLADIIIRENEMRYPKEFIANNGEGHPVKVKKFQSKETEKDYLISDLKEKQRLNQLKETAILFRTNVEATYYSEILMQSNIPFFIREKPKNSYQSFIFQDLFHYIKLSESTHVFIPEDFFSVMNKPLRYLNRNAIINDTITIEGLLGFYKEKTYMIPIIQKLDYDLKRMKDMNLFSKVNYIRKAIGYDDYLEDLSYRNHISVDNYKQEIAIIQEKMNLFGSLEELISHMNKMELLENQLKYDNKNDRIKDGVNIMTFHSAKGLEYRNVYIPDCNEGIIPHKRSHGKQEIEEERRMFYVGMTRAKEELTILYVHGNNDSIHMPSRFLHKIIKMGI